jgi:TonB family protein
MREIGFLPSGWLWTACALGLSWALPAAAQNATSAASPTDPKALLLAAAAANGGPERDSKPWHMKISFTVNGWDGKPEVQGTFEEFWAASDKAKLIYATSSFNQVEYITPAGVRRTGTPDGAPPEIARVIDQFLRPMPFESVAIGTIKLQAHDLALGTAKLTCITATAKSQTQTDPGLDGTWCINDTIPTLRLTIKGGGFQRTMFNNIIKFQGRYLAQTIERVLANPGEKSGRTQLTAKVETAEPLKEVDEAEFTPPAGALPPPQVITLDEKATKPQLLQHGPPVYPPIAKAARVSGDVVLALQVQSDGRVSQVRVLSGPAMLQQAAMDGVRKWTYNQFVQNGAAVEVNTTATVEFRLMP